jgi:hypothetical protein
MAFAVAISVRARWVLSFRYVRTTWFSWLCALSVRMRCPLRFERFSHICSNTLSVIFS